MCCTVMGSHTRFSLVGPTKVKDSKFFNSVKLFPTLGDQYHSPDWDSSLGVCLYLNLKHGDLDHLATTSGIV